MPTYPTTLGHIWIGQTQPTPEQIASLLTRGSQAFSGHDGLPTYPTTLGHVWIGQTQLTPEQLAELRALHSI